jgi:hypothetical protein
METEKIKKADYFAARSMEEKLAIHLTWMMIRKSIRHRLTAQEKYRTKKHLANLFKNHPTLIDEFKQIAIRAVLPPFVDSLQKGVRHSFSEATVGLVKAMIHH